MIKKGCFVGKSKRVSMNAANHNIGKNDKDESEKSIKIRAFPDLVYDISGVVEVTL